jgi:hypothetical protein
MNDSVIPGVGEIDFRLCGSGTSCDTISREAIVHKFYAVPISSSATVRRDRAEREDRPLSTPDNL